MSDKYFKNFDEIVAQITQSYVEEQYIIPQYSGTLPSIEVIIEITKQLRQLLFPGYFGKRNYAGQIIEYHTGEQVINIYEKLSEQINFALKHESRLLEDFNDENAGDKAEKLVYEFLKRIPKIREYLATDVQATFDGDPSVKTRDEVILASPGIFAISVYRIAHELYDLGVPLIPRIMSEYSHSLTGIDLHAGATIGKYFFIDHGTGVVIGETTKIGNNVKIYQGVTLGALSTRGGQSLSGVKRHPTIEDDVTIYSGSSILGGETTIGKSVVIGGNAFITNSVPAGTKVSVKNPELLYKDSEKPKEFIFDWVI